MAEISNKMLVSMVILSLAVTLGGMWVLYGKIQYSGLIANPTGTVSAVVAATTDIALQNSTVNFGNIGVGKTFRSSCLDNVGCRAACIISNYSNASVFAIRNDGSVEVNITVSATALFNSTSGNNSNYRFMADCPNIGNYSSASSCANGNLQGSWYTLPLSSSTYAACNLNYSDGKDYEVVGIEITVPQGEAAGTKTSTVTFTATQA